MGLLQEMQEKIERDIAAALCVPKSALAEEGQGLTATMLRETLLEHGHAMRRASLAPTIHFTPIALAETNIRLFPASRHRSARIHKKLLKRFGGEFRTMPAIWSINGAIYAHPSFKAAIENMIGKQEPLGQPFSQILHDNLFNLYAR